MKLVIALLICFVSGLIGCSSIEDSITARKLEEQILSALDDWVSSGGVIDDVQNTVVETCGKHVMVTDVECRQTCCPEARILIDEEAPLLDIAQQAFEEEKVPVHRVLAMGLHAIFGESL